MHIQYRQCSLIEIYCTHIHTMFSLIRCCRLNITRCLLITDVLLQAGKASSAAFTALFISSCVLHGTLLITSLVACIVGKLYVHTILMYGTYVMCTYTHYLCICNYKWLALLIDAKACVYHIIKEW